MMNRRQFLTTSSAAAWGLSAGAGALLDASVPVVRSGSFRLSVAAYSYRNLLTAKGGQEPSLSLFDFVDDCASFGVFGTELTSYYFPKDFDDAYTKRLKRHCFRQGLDISGTAIGNDFGHPPGPKRDEQMKLTKHWIRVASEMGIPVIRVFAGHAKNGMKEADARALMIEGLEESCEIAGRYGVHLALENHGGPTSTAKGLLAFVEAVKSPWFGVNLDTGNFHTEDPYKDLELVAPHAINVQVKVKVRRAGGSLEPTDYGRLGAILRDHHYRGYVVLEYEEGGDPREACQRTIEILQEKL